MLTFMLTLPSLGQSLEEVRKEFHKAVLDPKESRVFHDFMKDLPDVSSTTRAYAAVSEAMLAQVVWNPFSKLSQVIKYDKLMEEIIVNDPENVEIRFLRLAIEYNLPPFLGMSEHIQEDIDTIKSGIKVTRLEVDANYKRYIIYFLQQTKLCSNEELAMLEDSFDLQAAD